MHRKLSTLLLIVMALLALAACQPIQAPEKSAPDAQVRTRPS